LGHFSLSWRAFFAKIERNAGAAPYQYTAMSAKYLLPLIAMGMATALAGERETFDFGWQFKYFGPGDPSELGSPASADSSQAGHAPSCAIDGNIDTRWCAADGKPGHALVIKTGVKTKVAAISIDWENDRTKDVEVSYVSRGKTIKTAFKTSGAHSSIDVGGKPISGVRIKVNGTGSGNWASIREVTFTDAEGKKIDPIWAPRSNSPASPAYKTSGFKSVQLPHDWAIESPFLKDEPNETGKLPWNGYGWYRKSFDVPADFNPKTQRYYIDFDGVMANPQVYINGRKAGEWAYGYNSFRVDATPFLKAGQKNVVAVMASNKPESTRWYPGAGIYRHVWLEKTGPVHLAHWGVYVTTPKVSEQSATVKVQTTVQNTGEEPAVIKVSQEISGQKAEPVEVTVAPGSSEVVEQEIVLKNPELWSCESPRLYKLATTLYKDGAQIDGSETNVGIRTIEWKPDGFYLNGKRVQLNGVCEHHDLGPLGAAFHARGYERKIEILKGMGCNSIRMTHNPPAPEVLDLCDKHGILVVDELFDIWKYQKYGKVNGYHVYWPQWWKRDVENFMKRDRNHPSIIAWSGGNEIDEIVKPDGPQISAALRDEMRKYDATRPYTVGTNAAAGADNGFGDTEDVFGYNYKPWLYKQYSEKHPDKPFYASETASCVATRGMYFFPLRWGIGAGWDVVRGAEPFQVSAYGLYAPGWAYCPDAEFTAQDASGKVAGEYVWTGFDYIGEPTPFNQDASILNNFKDLPPAEREKRMKEFESMGKGAPSRSSYFGIIDLAGFPKDTYYLYQSHWAPHIKHAHLLPHWNWKGREGETTPVMCFSSGDEAELFVNGKSQGVVRRGEGKDFFHQAGMKIDKSAYRFVWENVKYEPGELKVVVKKDGKPWAQASRVTTGDAKKVKVGIDRDKIAGDARDLSYVSLILADAKGNEVPTDCRKVSFSISGPAELVGFCNGNPIDHRCMQDPNQAFFNGRILAVVRGKRGASGKAVVTIKAEGLPEANACVEIMPATKEQLRN